MHQSVKLLSDTLGFSLALEVVRRWGGRDWTVPMRVEEGSPLALTLGLEPARKLVAAYGGVRLQLPDERRAMIEARNAAIVRECRDNGRSHQQVALEFGLTRQFVQDIVRDAHRAALVAGGASTGPATQSGDATTQGRRHASKTNT